MSDISTAALSPDTEAVLLLCGRFGGEQGERHPVLTQKEYESLTRWLLERKLRPSDLLGAAATGLLGELVHCGLDSRRVESLLGRGTALALALEKWRRSGLWVQSRSDPLYPKRLKKKLGQSAPALLYGAGDHALLDTGGLAIVGSRDASDAALAFTREIARACAHDGLGVISGGAKGVDAAAMQGAGEAGGVVIGVLAAELLRASVNRPNRMGIQSGRLVLVSPFNPEAGFNAGNAMARNRYIYAFADYALVVDSAKGEGGTWAGAVENLRHGWTPLYVRMPGEKPGNAGLVAKGGATFAYRGVGTGTLRDYLVGTGQPETPTLFDALAPNAGAPEGEADDAATTVGAGATDRRAAVGEADVRYADAPAMDPASPGARSAGLDMFQDFLARLPLLLGQGAKSDEEIRLALGLEKSQVKVWLAAAVEQGLLEKRTRPVGYALRRQQPLC